MFLYTFYVFVYCLSVQLTLGHDLDNTYFGNIPKSVDSALNESTSRNEGKTTVEVQNHTACEKAASIHKLLGVIISILSEDVPKNTKTTYVMETLKDLLKNTQRDTDEVMFKIDDLKRTLDKFNETGTSGDETHLSVGSNNINSPSKPMLRNSVQPKPNLRSNSYCTEALLNILKITYQAYVSLAKNPICDLPALPELPTILSTNPSFNPSAALNTQFGAWNEYLPLSPPFPGPHSLPANQPIDLNNIEYIQNRNPEALVVKEPFQYNPVNKYFPNAYKDKENKPVPLDVSPFVPQNLNNLFPNQLSIQNKQDDQFQLPYLSQQSPFAQNLLPYYNKLPFDYNPATPLFSPYIQLQPLNPSFPTSDNTLTNSWEKKVPYYIVTDSNDKTMFEIPIQNESKEPNPKTLFEVNPSIMNPLYPNKYYSPNAITRQPVWQTPKNVNTVDKSPDNIFANDIIGLPYQPVTPLPNNVSPYLPSNAVIENPLFNPDSREPAKMIIEPLNPQTLPEITNGPYMPYPIYPNTVLPLDIEINSNNDVVKPDVLVSTIDEINFKPFEIRPNIQANIPQYNQRYPINEFQPKTNPLNPQVPPKYPYVPTNQNADYRYYINHNGSPIYPFIPNQVLQKWQPNTYPQLVQPQDFNQFQPFEPPKILQAPEFKTIVFIRDAINFIKDRIPVAYFDQPTLTNIAKIQDIIFENDNIEVLDYVTVLDLYTKLIDYVKQQNINKEIIDFIDLSRVTNRPKLESEKVVELTYLLKRPQPLVYYPYYYVKYTMPYTSYVVAAQNLLREKPHLRTNPKQLYEELLALSKVAETSPDLKTYNKQDLLRLTVKSGSLVDSKLVGENKTLVEELNVLRDIASDLTAEDILEHNKEPALQSLRINSKRKNYINNKLNASYENILKKTIKIHDDKQETKQSISHPSPITLLRITNQSNASKESDPKTYATRTNNVEIPTFKSGQLRSDILRGEYVGLPFPKYDLLTNTLHMSKPNSQINRESMYKLFNATLDAGKLRNVNQPYLMSSGGFPTKQKSYKSAGLDNYDNLKSSLNSGKNNNEEHLNSLISTNNNEEHLNSINPSATINGVSVSDFHLSNATPNQKQKQINLLNALMNFDATKQDYSNDDKINTRVINLEGLWKHANPKKQYSEAKIINKEQLNQSLNYHNKQSDETNKIPFNSQSTSDLDFTNTLLNAGNLNSETIHFKNNVDAIPTNNVITSDISNILYTDTSNDKNPFKELTVTENDKKRQKNNVLDQSDSETSQIYFGSINFGTGVTGQPILEDEQGLVSYDAGMDGHQTLTQLGNYYNGMAAGNQQASQREFLNFGPGTSLLGQQVNKYVMQGVPITYQRPIIQRFPITSTTPFLSPFRRPVNMMLG